MITEMAGTEISYFWGDKKGLWLWYMHANVYFFHERMRTRVWTIRTYAKLDAVECICNLFTVMCEGKTGIFLEDPMPNCLKQGRRRLLKLEVVLWYPHTCCGTCIFMHTYIHTPICTLNSNNIYIYIFQKELKVIIGSMGSLKSVQAQDFVSKNVNEWNNAVMLFHVGYLFVCIAVIHSYATQICIVSYHGYR